MADLTGPTVELLQALIRNECVNDGTPDSGHETRNAELLGGYLEGSGVGIEHFESRPGRGSVVARIEGSDPTAPTLCLMGHTDVVPVNPAGWSRDPFGGELIDGEVWGRGAIDMLNVTASMAVAFRQLAQSGWKPKGTLVYFGVADEEAGGHWGAEWMCDHHWDAIGSDYVHDPARIWSTIESLPPALARTCHAHTHTTFSPNVVHGGQKTNIIPDLVEIEVDIRTVPGTTQADVDAHLHEALGDLAHHVEIGRLQQFDATESPRGNPLWDALASATQVAYPGAELVPGLIVGGTDARFFRKRGVVAYGTGLFSPSVTFESFGNRFHGNDERIDTESLGLAADFWMHIARTICG